MSAPAYGPYSQIDDLAAVLDAANVTRAVLASRPMAFQPWQQRRWVLACNCVGVAQGPHIIGVVQVK